MDTQIVSVIGERSRVATSPSYAGGDRAEGDSGPCLRPDVDLRMLTPEDIPEVRSLCTEWFPIDYPVSWYQEITSNPKFYSLAAVHHHQIVGIIVCEIKPRTRCNREDCDILASQFPANTRMAYIMSLGVVAKHRRNGIASLLLDSLLAHVTSVSGPACRCVYLHVLTSNTPALRFYERHSFRMHSYLPYYYCINGAPCDGYSYVLYINGGQPPWSVVDYVKHVGNVIMKLQPCTIPQRVLNSAQVLLRCILPYPSASNGNKNGTTSSSSNGRANGQSSTTSQQHQAPHHAPMRAQNNAIS